MTFPRGCDGRALPLFISAVVVTAACAAGSAGMAAALMPVSGAIAGAPPRTLPDPAPYQSIHQSVEWMAPGGARLAFCLLGNDGPAARVIAVYRQEGAGWTRLFLDHDRSTHPWKLALAELDGDELPEILVAVRKPSRFDPQVRNRLFVFDWTPDRTIAPKWLGSRLGGTLVDFAVVPGAHNTDLIEVTEQSGPASTRSRRYAWSGFGFVLDQDGKGE